jgi:NADH-quinone oxidoreductase subunit N
MTFPTINLPVISPLIVLVATGLLVLVLDLLLVNKRLLGALSLLGMLGALAGVIWCGSQTPAFQDMAVADGMGRFASAVVLLGGALAVLLALDRVADFTARAGAYYALVLFATAGMVGMTISSNLMTIFLTLEILSVALYILVGFNRKDVRSGEAALKYFLLGAFASGFLLYGIALIYAATGTTSLTGISQALAPLSVSLPFAPLLPIGVGLLIVGFGFKVALVPFHMWTPDAYQGAPTPVTAFMSVATKAAAFTAFIRVLASLTSHDRPWLIALAVLAVLTMTLGNLAALRQSSLKRMLAYSSIAHAGYLLIGLAAGNGQGAQAALYYLAAYTFMTLGAFAVLLAVQRRDENDVSGERLTGLAGRQPVLALLMAVFMFSLAGIPPLAGFFGKLYVFSAAVDAGMAWLAIVGVINSAVGAYYYLRVTVAMYMAEPAAGAVEAPKPGWPVMTAIVLAALATLVLGVWQLPWMQSISQAVATLAMR